MPRRPPRRTSTETHTGSAVRPIACGVAVMLVVVLPCFMAASLAPEVGADFAYDEAGLGLVVALFFAVSALTAPAAGRLVDRVDTRTCVRIACAFTATCCVGIAVLAQSAVALGSLLAVAGFGNAIGSPAVSALMTKRIRLARRGVAFGIQHAGAPFAAVLAGLALPLVAVPLGWRWAFVAAAAVALVAAAATPSEGGGSATAERGGRVPHAVHLLGVAAGFANGAAVALVSFLVLFAIDAGLSAGQAGLLLAAASLSAGLTRIAAGALADRRGQGDVLFQGGVVLALASGGFLMLAAGELAVTVVAGALLGGGVGWGWQVLLSLAAVAEHPSAPGAAMGVEMSGLFAGAVVGPFLVGQLVDSLGFSAAWLVCAVACACAVVAVLAARRLSARRVS